MKTYNVVIFVLLFLFVSAFSQKAGEWTPIKNINDPHVTKTAQFAVTQYDQQSGKKLRLMKVIKGETQVVAGANYRLILVAKDRSTTKNYEAVVWEKPWIHFRNLTSFKPILV